MIEVGQSFGSLVAAEVVIGTVADPRGLLGRAVAFVDLPFLPLFGPAEILNTAISRCGSFLRHAR